MDTESPPPLPPVGECDATRDERMGRWLLLLATVLLLITSLRDITGPWENGLRGGVAARYTDVAAYQTVRYGLAITLGLPAFIVEEDGKLVRKLNYHHPPYYWLYESFWGWLLGVTPMALRIGQLFLFFPGLWALFCLVRRHAGPIAAGWAALFFATAPLIAYYGPMALQDGAVLGCGLYTLWRFQRLCDQPNARNWLACAAMFFVSASWDFSGYWWGPAMFVLAFAQPRRWHALLWVATMAPVSVLAFATMAWHFNLDETMAQTGFVHELRTLIEMEGQGVQENVTFGRFLEAMRLVWLDHYNAWLLVLALLGTGVSIAFARLRPLLLVGLATLLPGLLNYGSMFRHAVDHAFWSVHGFAGLCVLAAAVPAIDVAWLRARGMLALRWVCLAAAATVVVAGHIGTHILIARWENHESNDTIAVVQKALPFLDECNTVMTSAPPVTQVQIDHLSMLYAIDTAVKLQAFVTAGRERGFKDKVGFVVHPKHSSPAMLAILDGMAKRIDAGDGVLVYVLSFR